ncbi:hypothetical protein E8E12_008018 [Didymella heteroderae]|uniref:SMP-30/Gluconolactonase/LRE-like region domain-containing protein n=1 Tax=Didymella heteroderae TaxID=1769908 RepID=A0A9P5C7C7_9PLEO|nr:hypothetical protein E8E12_008018 [Didymella heteroderae]
MRGLPLFANAICALFASSVFAAPSSCPAPAYSTNVSTTSTSTSSAPALSTVYQFPAGSGAWVENIAERSNGQLLITRMFTPELWLIDPSSGSAQLLYTFPDANSVTGITPTGNADEFAVAVGNVDAATFTPEAGSFSTWKVSLKGSKAIASLVTKLPEAKFLNGMGFFKAGKSKGLLITDSVVGGIWAVDLATGASSLALQDNTMLAPAGATFAVGIDGFRIKGNSLYYTVFAGGVLRRIDVEFPSAADLAAGTATLKQTAVVELANTGGSFDDLDVAADGTVYITTNPENTVVKVAAAGGKPTLVAGNIGSLALAGASSALLSKVAANVLYVTTSGGVAAPVNGTLSEAGKIMKIVL